MDKDSPGGGGGLVRSFALRPVQVAALDGIRQHWRNIDGGDKRALVILPTGVGKTITALEAVRRAVVNGVRCLWLAHREELVTQPYTTVQTVEHFGAVAKVAGIVKGSRNETDRQVVFSSVQTMAHRGGDYLAHGAPGLVVIDEAHHYAPGSKWYETALHLVGADGDTGAGGCHVIGLTATPQRGDNVALSAMWGAFPSYCFTLAQAMEAGYLLPPVFVREPMAMSSELEAAMAVCNADGASDVSKQAAKRLLDEGIADHTADCVVERLGEHSGHVLVYCASVAQVGATVEAIEARCAESVRVGMVTGKTPATERRELLEGFMAGDVRVLVNCDVLTEGTDLPIADTIVLARPCGSKALYVQIVGRGARLYPGQSSFEVVDILGASAVHDLEQAPVLDIGAAEVDGRSKSDADLSICASADIETPFIVAPERSLWTADIIERWPPVDPMADDEPWRGLVRIRGPYTRSIGGRPVGAWVESKKSEEDRRPEIIAEVGQGKDWSVYHAVRVARPITDEPWQVAWVVLRDGVHAVDIGKHGSLFSIPAETGGCRWLARIAFRGRKVTPLTSAPVAMDIAELLVRDVVRRAGDGAKEARALASADAGWRRGPVTDAQRDMLDRYDLPHPKTKGEATIAITRAKLQAKADRYGLRRGWSPGGAK